MQGDKLFKNLQISVAKFRIFFWYIENDLSFSTSSQNMIRSRNKQFLMPSHEDGWSYCGVFLNETSILKKDNN